MYLSHLNERQLRNLIKSAYQMVNTAKDNCKILDAAYYTI
jgi:hypothetical protein